MSVFYGDDAHAAADRYTLTALAYERAQRLSDIISDNPEYSDEHNVLEV